MLERPDLRLWIRLRGEDHHAKSFLRYELTIVRVTGYSVSGDAGSGTLPTVTISNSFEQIKVTYTEYDDETGSSLGNVETQFQVGPGQR